MNQDTLNGMQVGILVDLGSPFNTNQSELNIETCTTNETSIQHPAFTEQHPTGEKTQEMSQKGFSESSLKNDEENKPEQLFSGEESRKNSQEFKWNEDIPLVENEQFDFDLSLSPSSTNADDSKNDDEDDEVFFGPVNHREKCVRAQQEIDTPLSPLTNEQYAELFKEAIGLVMDLQQDDTKQKKTSGETEEFICKTLETLKLTKQYDSSPESSSTIGCNKPAFAETFKRDQKKVIRSPRRQTYTISKNAHLISELPKASECVSKLKPTNNTVFQAKGCVQRTLKNKSFKGNLSSSKVAIAKKKPELAKHSVRTSPPKRTRRSSVCSDEGISDTSSIISDVSDTSTSSIPVPGRKRSLPLPKVKKSGFAVPTKPASENLTAIKVAAPSKKPTLLKPGTFHRQTLIAKRSDKVQQPVKATMSLKSTKKTTPDSKTQPGINDRGKTPKSSMSATKSMKKSIPYVNLPSTPSYQEKKVVPKRIITSIPKGKSTSPSSAFKSTSSTTPSISRRRSGIPTPMRSTTKIRSHPMSVSSSVSDSPVFSDMMQVIDNTHLASPECTHIKKVARTFAMKQNASGDTKSFVKASPAKTPVLIDLNVSPKVTNLINFGETPETKEATIDIPVNEKENLLIVI